MEIDSMLNSVTLTVSMHIYTYIWTHWNNYLNNCIRICTIFDWFCQLCTTDVITIITSRKTLLTFKAALGNRNIM